MIKTTEFVSELIRAANLIGAISVSEQRRLLERAIIVILNLRRADEIPRNAEGNDEITELGILVWKLDELAVEADDAKSGLLRAAGMIRDLHLILDTGTTINVRHRPVR